MNISNSNRWYSRRLKCILFIQLAASRMWCFCHSCCQKFLFMILLGLSHTKYFAFITVEVRRFFLLVFYTAGCYVKYLGFSSPVYRNTHTLTLYSRRAPGSIMSWWDNFAKNICHSGTKAWKYLFFFYRATHTPADTSCSTHNNYG